MFFSIAMLLTSLTTPGCSDDAPEIPVRGDKEILEAVIAGMETARSRFREGRLSGVAWFRTEKAIIHELAWSGNKRYCDFEIHHFKTTKKSGDFHAAPRRITIVNDREILTWIPKSEIVTRFPEATASLPQIVQISPQDNWFNFQDTTIPLERMIDFDDPKGAVTALRVEQTGDRVRVVREHRGGDHLAFQFDLALGGLPISYESTNSERYTGRYTWRKVNDTDYYLAEYSWSRVLNEDSRQDVPHFSMKVEEWNSDIAFPRTKFELQSLNLPDGTQIRTHGASGAVEHVEWIGGRPPTFEERLERLGDALRSRGFGRVKVDQ